MEQLKDKYKYNPSKRWWFSQSFKPTEEEFDLLIRALQSYLYKIGEQNRDDPPFAENAVIFSVAKKLIDCASESE